MYIVRYDNKTFEFKAMQPVVFQRLWLRSLRICGLLLREELLNRIVQGSGSWWVGLVFWALAQIVLLIVGLLYEFTTTHKIHEELERDNAAVGLAFGGVLVGMGNIISLAVAGDFVSWSQSLTLFAVDSVFGLVVLYVMKRLTDALLAPGVKLSQQQTARPPNTGAGLLEAFGYVGGSMLVVWVF